MMTVMIELCSDQTANSGMWMNAGTEKIIATAMEMDLSISNEQRSEVMRVLKHGVRAVPTRCTSLAVESPQGTPPKTSTKLYLRRQEAANYLGCSVRQIDQMKHDGDLPFHKLGRRLIVFKAQDLDALMKRSRVDVSDMPEQ